MNRLPALRPVAHDGHPDATTIKRELISQAERICRHLLPAGKQDGREWQCGNLRGDPGQSLSVNLATGIWHDFATGEGGSNLLELWRQVRGIQFAAALHEAAAFVSQAAPEPEHFQKGDEAARKRSNWPNFEAGSRGDRLNVANLRGIAPEGIELASERGLLWFAD